VIWGAGPVFVLPTATSKVLGQGKLSMGPSFVALVQPGHWGFGALVNNAWSAAGPSDRAAVSQMTLQYFINYNLKKGWSLSWAPIVNANWKASDGNVWAVEWAECSVWDFNRSMPVCRSIETLYIRPVVLLGACVYRLHFYSQKGRRRSKRTKH
jgi:hypothetical protein